MMIKLAKTCYNDFGTHHRISRNRDLLERNSIYFARRPFFVQVAVSMLLPDTG